MIPLVGCAALIRARKPRASGDDPQEIVTAAMPLM